MDAELLDLYNQELALLREWAAEFAEEYPGIAERLGGLVGEKSDPMTAGLIDGAAFLAARVQLKLRHEYLEFTANLLEELVPQFLAPTPSYLLAKVTPPFGDPGLREGRSLRRGAVLEAAQRVRDRTVECTFQLTSSLTIWPIELAEAEYHLSAAALAALKVPASRECLAGLRLAFRLRATADPLAEPPDREAFAKPELGFAACGAEEINVHLLGTEADSIALYQEIFAHRLGIYVRYVDRTGDPVVFRAPDDLIQQIGFEEDEALMPGDARVFRGFDLVREYFAFPQKFLGFRLNGFDRVRGRIPAKSFELIIPFDEIVDRLAASVRPSTFELYAAPAVNLFDRQLDRVRVTEGQHEFHVVPSRSRPLGFEPYRVTEVTAHLAGEGRQIQVLPLYAPGLAAVAAGSVDIRYAVRRLPRRRTSDERKYEHRSDYAGTEMYLSLSEAGSKNELGSVSELSVRAVCTNRHLAEQLQTGPGGADFHFLDDTALGVTCVAGPTPPREPLASMLRGRGETSSSGEVAWRLISMLRLNHLGLVDRAAGKDAGSLREILLLLANPATAATERRIRGVRRIDSRPVVRRVAQKGGVGIARGLEVTVVLDDKAFEGSGAFLLGAVLDRFLAEYVAINHFTETVIVTTDRGEIARWPARSGSRGPL